MGSELVGNSPPSTTGGGDKTAPLVDYTEKFNELFPYYLSIGMTDDEYWDKDCTLVVAYRKAEIMRQDRINLESWLQGAYIYEALCRVSPVLHAFAKKGTKPKPYIEEPYSITQKQAELQKMETAKKTYNKGKRLMERFIADTNKKFKRGVESV